MDTQSLYVQLGRLAESIPNFKGPRPFPITTHQWLARLHALLNAAARNVDANRVENLTRSMATSASDTEVHEIYSILFRTLAAAEVEAPASSQGAFIPVGNAFDALAAIGKVFKEATTDLLIVDPYLDEKVLTDFALQVSEGVSIRLLSDSSSYKATLVPAVARWTKQYGPKRPLLARLAPSKALHDRLVIADNSKTWVLTQSIKDFAARSPASITRSDDEAAALKVGAYQSMWDLSAPLQ